MAQKNHQNCCNTQPRHAHRNENKSEILLNVTMEGAKARGLAYWQLLSDIINQEPVHERDRIIIATLKPLGIEKGKPFQPDARQKKILEDAAFVGEAMAKANSFDKRFAGSRYRPETHWDYVIAVDWIAETEFYRQLDELSAYTYEATGTSKGMVTKTPGVGQAYLATYRDTEGHAFDGANTYHLHVPPNAPVKNFWSVTLYDLDTRTFIENKKKLPTARPAWICARTTMAAWTFILVRLLALVLRKTGFQRSPAGRGSPTSDCMDHWTRTSTRAGRCQTSRR